MVFNEKQVQIIERAEKLFAVKGFDGTSVRDIADEAGVNVAMISYYFGSKEKLMEALFEIRVGNIRLRIEDLMKDDSIAPIDKINKLIDEHIEKALQKQCFYKIMVSLQINNHYPALIKTVNDVKIRNAEAITELIKDGQKKGAFKKKIDVILMLNTMIGTVSQSIISKEYYRTFNKQQDILNEEFDIIFKRKLSIHIKTLFKSILTNEA